MRSTRRRARVIALGLGLALAPVACGDDDGGEGASESGAATEAATATDAGTSGTDTDAGSSGGTGTGADTEPSGDPDGPWDSLDERYCPPESFLTYENFGAPFINSYCTGCHHVALAKDDRQLAPLGVDFETLDKIRAQADRIWARSGDQNATMPPAGAPADDERAMLGEWLACGAKGAAGLGP